MIAHFSVFKSKPVHNMSGKLIVGTLFNGKLIAKYLLEELLGSKADFILKFRTINKCFFR